MSVCLMTVEMCGLNCTEHGTEYSVAEIAAASLKWFSVFVQQAACVIYGMFCKCKPQSVSFYNAHGTKMYALI